MRLKSLIAAAALSVGLAGTGLAGTGLAAAEATTATPEPTASPGNLKPSRPGDRPARPGVRPARPGEPPAAAPPGRALPGVPNYTG
jgi:hypothetical protein